MKPLRAETIGITVMIEEEERIVGSQVDRGGHPDTRSTFRGVAGETW